MSIWSSLGDIVLAPFSLIPGLGGYIGAHQQNAANKEMMEMQNQFNAEQSELAYNRTINLWNMQNAYNTPASQLQRLRDAGLSPYLAYSNAAAGGTASSMSAPSAVRSATMQFQSPIAAASAQLQNLVPAIQNYQLNDEKVKQEKTRTGLLKELLWSQIAKNNQGATNLSLRNTYQSMLNHVYEKTGISKAEQEVELLRNRVSASTYDKLLAKARLSNLLETNEVLKARRELNKQTIDYNNEFGYNGRLDWQAGVMGQGLKGARDFITSLLFRGLGKRR